MLLKKILALRADLDGLLLDLDRFGYITLLNTIKNGTRNSTDLYILQSAIDLIEEYLKQSLEFSNNKF